MLPELLISKFKSRIRSSLQSNSSSVLDSELELDSNPRLYLHSRRRYLINSIPLLSIVALLVGVGISLFPDFLHATNPVYAAEEDNIDSFAATAGLSVGTGGTLTGSAAPGGVAYISNTVTITATDVSEYTLNINAPVILSGPTTISGANNSTPSDMDNNTWGFSYDEADMLNSNKIYRSFTGSNQVLESGITPSSTAKDITIAAKFGTDAINGHYTANIMLSLIATPLAVTYTVSYDVNGGSGTIEPTTCLAQGPAGTSCTAPISPTIPTRINYEFLGWAESNTATSAQYASGSNINITSDKTLFAVWRAEKTINDIIYMQDMTSNICNSSSSGINYSLKDSRDNTTYSIRKFADGRCWMLSDLKITGTIQASASDFTSPTSLTIPNSQSGFTSTDQTTLKSYISSTSGYYNWYTATATSGTSSISSGSVNTSICPRGWTLPSATEFRSFINAEGITNSSAGSIKIQGAPYNFKYTGYVSDSALTLNTSDGYWWSRTAYNSSHAYRLFTATNNVVTTEGGSRYRGYAIRCIAIQ